MYRQTAEADVDRSVLVFRALANPERLALLGVLQRSAPGWRNISQLAAEAGVTRYGASRHLAVLAEAGFVEVIRDRQAQLHRLHPRGFEAVEDFVYDVLPALEACTGR